MHLSELFIYPVKGLGGIAVSQFAVTERGPAHDRRWMIVNDKGRFVSQREQAQLALLQCEMQGEEIVVRRKGCPEFLARLPRVLAEGALIETKIWKNKVKARVADEVSNAAISDFLGKDSRFVYMPDHSHRIVDPKYAPEIELVSFADGFPYLVIGQSSLDDLNVRLRERGQVPVPMDRFRPNLVVAGGAPNEEFTWAELRIGAVDFEGRKPCSRCVVTTVDQTTGEKGREPLRTLARYLMRDRKIYFGENLIVTGEGTIRIGDAVTVQRRKDWQ
ncbi:MAG: MOSC N-terminal beta barrel domain-containing protein [Bacteroidota bacterium]